MLEYALPPADYKVQRKNLLANVMVNISKTIQEATHRKVHSTEYFHYKDCLNLALMDITYISRQYLKKPHYSESEIQQCILEHQRYFMDIFQDLFTKCILKETYQKTQDLDLNSIIYSIERLTIIPSKQQLSTDRFYHAISASFTAPTTLEPRKVLDILIACILLSLKYTTDFQDYHTKDFASLYCDQFEQFGYPSRNCLAEIEELKLVLEYYAQLYNANSKIDSTNQKGNYLSKLFRKYDQEFKNLYQSMSNEDQPLDYQNILALKNLLLRMSYRFFGYRDELKLLFQIVPKLIRRTNYYLQIVEKNCQIIKDLELKYLTLLDWRVSEFEMEPFKPPNPKMIDPNSDDNQKEPLTPLFRLRRENSFVATLQRSRSSDDLQNSMNKSPCFI